MIETFNLSLRDSDDRSYNIVLGSPGQTPTLIPILTQSPGLGLNRSQKKVIALLVGLSLMSYFQRTAMSIAGPSIAREFSLSETQMGAIFSAFLLGYALLMIPGGWLADRIGPHRALIIVGFGTAVLTAITALGGPPGLGAILGVFPAFLGIRLLLGIVSAPLYPSAARMNANWMDIGVRAQVQGWIAGGAGIGGALSPLVFSHLIASSGWRIAFVITGAATALLAVVWMTAAGDYPRDLARPPQSARHRTPWRMLLTNRNLMLLTAGYFAVDYFEYIFFYWTFYYLGQIRHMGSAQSAVYTTGLFLSWMIFAPAGGKVSDLCVRRFGLNRGMRIVPIAALSLSAVILFAALGLRGAEMTGVLMALALGLAAATDGPYWAATINVGGEEAGAACGLLNTGGNLGGFLAPVVTPWIASQFGWSAGLYFGCLVVSLSIAVWFFIDLDRRSAGSLVTP
jgi:MFS family permease